MQEQPLSNIWSVLSQNLILQLKFQNLVPHTTLLGKKFLKLAKILNFHYGFWTRNPFFIVSRKVSNSDISYLNHFDLIFKLTLN